MNVMDLMRAGRNGDTLIAHISPKEASVLKSMGGSGSINPKTGLPEFFDDEVNDQGVAADSTAGGDTAIGGTSTSDAADSSTLSMDEYIKNWTTGAEGQKWASDFSARNQEIINQNEGGSGIWDTDPRGEWGYDAFNSATSGVPRFGSAAPVSTLQASGKMFDILNPDAKVDRYTPGAGGEYTKERLAPRERGGLFRSIGNFLTDTRDTVMDDVVGKGIGAGVKAVEPYIPAATLALMTAISGYGALNGLGMTGSASGAAGAGSASIDPALSAAAAEELGFGTYGLTGAEAAGAGTAGAGAAGAAAGLGGNAAIDSSLIAAEELGLGGAATAGTGILGTIGNAASSLLNSKFAPFGVMAGLQALSGGSQGAANNNSNWMESLAPESTSSESFVYPLQQKRYPWSSLASSGRGGGGLSRLMR